MKLIVGLGNPGKEYSNTRHNVGFMVIDNYLGNISLSKKFNAEYYKTDNAIFIKPLTYMNLSGDAVVQFKNYFKISTEDILVIRDDLDLNIGSAKIKFSSSSGGDNGIKSIIERLGTKDFAQFKIGISNNKNIETKDYVLGKFNSDELKELNKIIDNSKQVIDYFIDNDIQKTMSYFNGMLK